MSAADEYLRIPQTYVRPLGRLRWSRDAEVVEYHDGSTLVFTDPILQFLEGFASVSPLIHFGFILHLLCLLRQYPTGNSENDDCRKKLFKAFKGAGKYRNAGAFFAHLCQELPQAHIEQSRSDQPGLQNLLLAQVTELLDTQDRARHLHMHMPGTTPPLSTQQFEQHILTKVRKYSWEEIRHWFTHGCGTLRLRDKAQVQLPLEDRSPSFPEIVEELAQRHRLAGAVPFVDQLLSALELPPRRLAQQGLPLGGYSDVTTRGKPEHLLAGQFALDGLEFIRRHSENELLYYRREEPHQRHEEQLLVLLDQGVRTWGFVRLVLTAAVFALGRRSDLRAQPFLLATTSNEGTLLDPLQMDREELGRLLEGSDLELHPGQALESMLEQVALSQIEEKPLVGPSRERANKCFTDVVLLTHPRSLVEEGVREATKKMPADTRLFALSVDDEARAEWSEVRAGSFPVVRTSFRVDLQRSATPTSPPEQNVAGVWSGDVEPIPFPFRFGASSQPIVLGDFDHEGNWFIQANSHGWLLATRTDGSHMEMLPRPLLAGKVFIRPWDQLIGVAGVFVIAGRNLLAAHYDFATRRVRVHRLDSFQRDALLPKSSSPSDSIPNWVYLHHCHTLAVHTAEMLQCVHLDTSSREIPPEAARLHLRVRESGETTGDRMMLPLSMRSGDELRDAERTWFRPWLEFSPSMGTIELHHAWQGWCLFRPESDGRPALRNARILGASCQANTLALLMQEENGQQKMRLFQGPEGIALAELAQPTGLTLHALSRDGQLLARQVRSTRIEIRSVVGFPGTVRTQTQVGRFHHDLAVKLGKDWLHMGFPGNVYRIFWTEGQLRVEHNGRDSGRDSVVARPWQVLGDLATVSHGRFVAAARNEQLMVAAVDCFGQVALFNSRGDLICMCFMFRQQLAMWMPDGTCHGSPQLLGRHPTPGAAQTIGAALWNGEQEGERWASAP